MEGVQKRSQDVTTPTPISRDVSLEGPVETQAGLFSLGLNIPPLIEGATPVEYAEALGEAYLAVAKHDHRKNGGHYLTPVAIARFMAQSFAYSESHLRVLDPGSGAGILSAAVCEAASGSGTVHRLHVDAYEVDPLLANLTHRALTFAREWLIQRGVALTFNVRQEDFILAYRGTKEVTVMADSGQKSNDGLNPKYGLVISNPPYFKINKDDPRAIIGAAVVLGQPNIYALFMAASVELLSESGRVVYIVPRSFASGPYFRRFREVFFTSVIPTAIHLFKSRRDVFKNQTVLQENLIMTARSRIEGEVPEDRQVLVSHSYAADDLADRKQLLVGLDSVLDPSSVNKELSIPSCAEDIELVRSVRAWPNTLKSLGLDVSTGPVVPFRATRFLEQDASRPSAVPLLWMHHVRAMRVEWPSAATNKPQWARSAVESMKLMVPDQTYVLLRRFSAKEEKRRLVAAPLVRGYLNADMVALENHLNYIRGVSRELDEELAYGIAALLNSTLLDQYFRLSNGSTQVGATELRVMPLPVEQDIRTIGADVHAGVNSGSDLPMIDTLVARTLNLPSELWMGRESATE